MGEGGGETRGEAHDTVEVGDKVQVGEREACAGDAGVGAAARAARSHFSRAAAALRVALLRHSRPHTASSAKVALRSTDALS